MTLIELAALIFIIVTIGPWVLAAAAWIVIGIVYAVIALLTPAKED